MSFIKTGNCKQCGAPIWSSMPWNAPTPPPNHFSCDCMGQIVITPTPLQNNKNELTSIMEEIKKLTKIITELSDRVLKLEQEKKKINGILKD